MSLPHIDVVILSWNRVEMTVDAVDSAHAQTGVQVHVIVVDQDSDGDTLEVLRTEQAAGRLRLIELGENVGVGGGRNRGMAAGDSPVVVCIDNDAVFEDDTTLAQTLTRFQQNPDLAAIGYRIRIYATRADDRLSWVYPRALLSKRDEQFKATRFCGAGHAIRRAALDQTNGYDDALFFMWEELDLSYQFINAGYDVIYAPDLAVLHKVSPEARTDWSNGRFYYLVRNALYLHYKYFGVTHSLLTLAVGYQVKGLFNRVLGQSLRGLWDALNMMRRIPTDHRIPMSTRAQQYIQAHDLAHRGSFWRRLRQETLERLP